VDATSGRVLFEDHADEVSPPASMTKLMTFAVLDDRIRSGAFTLQTPITATAADARVGMLKDSTSVWLKTGETFPVEELIYAMMIQSANDAAYTLAHASAGSVPAFVEWMNAKARALGMNHTTFRSPNGLPPPSRRIADGDLTTPRDFAILCRYLLLRTDILKYTSVRSRAFGAGRRFPPTMMTNHNHLLGRIAGVDGLKTGFTSGAGFCLSATALRNGHRIIAVMMDSPDSQSRDLKIAQLIERGFAIDSIVVPPVSVPAPSAGAANSSAPKAAPAGNTGIQFSVPGLSQ
jgi:D-alanyl-D-alanine carboxypeptidase (penicillin-binding protein 5/6)